MRKLKDYFQIQFDNESILKINRNDGIVSILYYIYYLSFIYLFGLFYIKMKPYIYTSGFSKEFTAFVYYIPVPILTLLPLAFILKFRKQSFASIGIKKDKILRSLILGFTYSLPVSVPFFIYSLYQGSRLNLNIFDLFWLFLYYFICIAFVEEVIFRGYIQTRIQTIIKNKWLSIYTVGLMFAFMHVPFQMLIANMSFIQFLLNDYIHLIITGLYHIYFVYIYTRENHILAPTLTHAVINFTPHLFV